MLCAYGYYVIVTASFSTQASSSLVKCSDLSRCIFKLTDHWYLKVTLNLNLISAHYGILDADVIIQRPMDTWYNPLEGRFLWSIKYLLVRAFCPLFSLFVDLFHHYNC